MGGWWEVKERTASERTDLGDAVGFELLQFREVILGRLVHARLQVSRPLALHLALWDTKHDVILHSSAHQSLKISQVDA